MTTIVRPKGTENMYLFVSDGVAGHIRNDLLVQLAGIPTGRQIELSGGDLTVLL